MALAALVRRIRNGPSPLIHQRTQRIHLRIASQVHTLASKCYAIADTIECKVSFLPMIHRPHQDIVFRAKGLGAVIGIITDQGYGDECMRARLRDCLARNTANKQRQ